MKKLRVLREYDVVLPTRGSPMWRRLEQEISAEALDGLSGLDLDKARHELADVLKSDEAVATWLTYKNDIGEFELGPEEADPNVETFGAELIDSTAYDPTVYTWSLSSAQKKDPHDGSTHTCDDGPECARADGLLK